MFLTRRETLQADAFVFEFISGKQNETHGVKNTNVGRLRLRMSLARSTGDSFCRRTAKRTLLRYIHMWFNMSDAQTAIAGHHRACSSQVVSAVQAYNLEQLSAPAVLMRAMMDDIVSHAFDLDKPTGLEWTPGEAKQAPFFEQRLQQQDKEAEVAPNDASDMQLLEDAAHLLQASDDEQVCVTE